MIRRALAAVAVAGVALAVPVTASAVTYPADDATLECSATQVAPNESFECTITAEGGTEAQLQATTAGENASIAGTVTSAPKDITSGTADFTVTAPSVEGTIGLTAIVDGIVVDETATVIVTDQLSVTGFDSTPLAIGAGVLLVAGAAVVFVAARRRSSQNS